MRRNLHAALCGTYLAVAAGAHLVALQPAGTRGTAYIALHLALTGLMLGVWVAGRGLPDAPRWALWTGVAAHVLLLAVPSFTSHDVLRYLWDGHAVLAGADPYLVAPAAAEWIEGWPRPPDNLDYPTLYPPGALSLFALAAAAGPRLGPWVFQAMVLVAALAILAWGARLLRERGAGGHVALLALSPLLLLEAQVGAHVDVFATAALVGALLLYHRRRWAWAGAVLGLGGLIKLVPLVVVLPLALAAGTGGVPLALASAGTVAAGYGIALAAGLEPLGSLPVFFSEWDFGSPVFAALASVLQEDSSARLVLGGMAIGAYGAILISVRRGAGLRGARWALVVPLVLSPVVFPWYLIPLVPLIAWNPSAAFLGWLTAVPLTYEVLDRFEVGEGWVPRLWPLVGIAGAWGIGLLVDAVRARRSAPDAAAVVPPRVPVRNAGRLSEDVG
ncbi:MAG: glycosyltransferase 87 family protein [Myxococcota bacterium]